MTSQKKIVLIGPVYPYRGGNALFTSYLYDMLKPHFEVTVLNYTLLYPSLLFPGTTQYDQSAQVAKQVPSERVVNSINPLSWWKAARRIRQIDPDLIVIDWWNPFFGPTHFGISLLAGNTYRQRILMNTHNVISHEARLVDRLLTRIGFHFPGQFLALCNDVEQELKRFADKRTVYRSEHPIYDVYSKGADFDPKQERAALNLNPDDHVLLFFGYVRKYKGLDVLIKAMPALLREDPKIRLLIVGEFYDKPEIYTRLIDELDVQSYVHVINQYVPNEEVGRYYAAADLVVLPYRSATQSGILTIAYDYERPVLVTNVGGLAEYVDDGQTGFIVEPESPEALVAGIQQFFAVRQTVDFNQNIQRKIGQNAFNQIPELFQQIIRDIESRH